MNDERVEQLLRAADRADGPPKGVSPDLARRSRRAYDGRRRRRSRAALLGALMVGYLLGAGTLWVVGQRGIPPVNPGRIAVDESPERDSPRLRQPGIAVSDSPQSAAQQPMTLPLLTASEYERMRRLGDRYLTSRGDVLTALEFYNRALEAASNEERAISEKDSWLLRSLKEDQYFSQRESSNGGSI